MSYTPARWLPGAHATTVFASWPRFAPRLAQARAIELLARAVGLPWRPSGARRRTGRGPAPEAGAT
jgi:hypothetical protein